MQEAHSRLHQMRTARVLKRVLLGVGVAFLAYCLWTFGALAAIALVNRMGDSGYVGIAVRNETSRVVIIRFAVWEEGAGQVQDRIIRIAPAETGLAGYVSKHQRIVKMEVRLSDGRSSTITLSGDQFRRASDLGVLHLKVMGENLVLDAKS